MLPRAKLGPPRSREGWQAESSRRRPFAGAQIDRRPSAIEGKIVGVGSAAVPDGHEDTVLGGRGDSVPIARRALADIVDRELPGRRVPSVRRIGRVGIVVGAVDLLQRRDVIHHQSLRIAPILVGVAAAIGEVLAGEGPVGHYRIFDRIAAAADRHREFVPMLEAERVAGLVKDTHPGVIALGRRIEIGLVEPGAAGFVRIAGQIGVGRAGGVGHRIAKLRGALIVVEELGEGQLGQRRDMLQHQLHRGLLGAGEGREARRFRISGSPNGDG